jgi:uncharacterized protein
MHSSPTFLTARIIATLLLIATQWFFYRHFRSYATEHSGNPWLLRTITVVFILATAPLSTIFITTPFLRTAPGWVITLFVVPFYIWHFSFLIVFIVLMAGKGIRFLVRQALKLLKLIIPSAVTPALPVPAPESIPPDARRRLFVRQGITILAGATLSGSAYGAIRRDDFELTETSIPVKGLPPEFVGYRIALVTDIHSSVFMDKAEMERYAAVINRTRADIIIVGGDFVNSSVEEVYPFAEAFSQLKAPDGVFGVLGNHDYYTRNVDTVVREVNQAGIRLLVNERVILRRGKEYVYLLGSDDIGTPPVASRVFDSLIAGTEPGIPRILVCHRPYFFEEAARRAIDLTLSGHTHGGQVVFMRLGNDVLAPARMVSPYVEGLYTIGSSRMYVSRGIGTVGVPIRINCPPEVTLLTLVGDHSS